MTRSLDKGRSPAAVTPSVIQFGPLEGLADVVSRLLVLGIVECRLEVGFDPVLILYLGTHTKKNIVR